MFCTIPFIFHDLLVRMIDQSSDSLIIQFIDPGTVKQEYKTEKMKYRFVIFHHHLSGKS